MMKILLAAFVLGIPEHKLRVISPEVGGGFGAKIFLYPDMAITAWASKRLARPVKFVETPAARTTWRPPTGATTSRTWRWPPGATARSPACA